MKLTQPNRGVRWLGAFLLVSLSACGESRPSLPGQPPVLHLLADADSVELIEGFGNFQRLEAWNDLDAVNPDREEILLRIKRNGRLRWRVAVPAGSVFRTGLVRLPFGSAADELPCVVNVRLFSATGDQLSKNSTPLPTTYAMPGAREDNWREATHVVQLSISTTEPVAAVEIHVAAENAPENALVGLLSPRFEIPAERVPLSARPIAWPAQSKRLMARLEHSDREAEVLSSWRTADAPNSAQREAAGLPNAGVEQLEPLREEGKFFGNKSRHALGFLDGAAATWQAQPLGGLHLRGSVALDARMPAGSEGQFVVRVNGTERARVTVRSKHWESVDLDLGVPREDQAPAVLEIALERVSLPSGEVVLAVPDLVAGTTERRLHRAERLRAGFAEPRLESPWGEQVREAASAERPSVLLIHVETLRADILSGRGVPSDLTPNLMRLARAGVHYTEAVAPSPWTLPSSATLFTGLSPSSHGVVNHERTVLPDAAISLAERLRSAGWVTAGMVTNTLLNGHAGWSRGFNHWLELPYVHMRQLGALARDWVSAQGDSRWFLFLHPFDPHGPHNAPAEFRDRYVDLELRQLVFSEVSARVVARMRDLEPLAPDDPDLRFLRQRYFGDVAYLDREVGRLLEALDEQGVLTNTAVVLTGDHGEEFGEHGFWGHGSNLHSAATRVPLVLVPPGALAGWSQGSESRSGRTVDELVSTDGLHATLLGLLGIEAPAELRPALGEQLKRAPAVWIETDKALAVNVHVLADEPAQGAPPRVELSEDDLLRRLSRAVRTSTHLLVRSFPVPHEVDPESLEPRQPWDEFWALDGPLGESQPLPLEGEVYEQLAGFLRAQIERSFSQALRVPGAGGGLEQLEALQQLGYIELPRDSSGTPSGDG